MRLGSACIIAATAVAILASAAPPPSATARPPERIYATTCGYCHGRNVGPVIRGRQLPVDAIVAIVRAGQNGMPAFRPTEIAPAELNQLAKWISTSAADPAEHGN